MTMCNEQEFKQQLDALSDTLTVYGVKGTDKKFSRWQKHFGDLSPEAFVQLQKAKGVDTGISVNFQDPARALVLLIYDRDNAEAGRAVFIVDEDNQGIKRIKNATSTVNSDFQSQDISKEIYRKRAEFGMAIGAKRIDLDAIDTGGYAWAKYGFTPDNESWQALKASISARLDTTSEPATVRFKNVAATLCDAELTAIKAILATDDNNLATSFAQLTKLNRVIGTIDEHPISIGKALLLDTEWSGSLPLNVNDPCYQRFEHYTGGTREPEISKG